MSLTTQASLQLQDLITEQKSMMQDEDTSSTFWTSTQRTTNLNKWYVWWYERFSNREVQMTGNATFGAIVAGTLKQASIDATVADFMHCHLETASGNFALGAELERVRDAHGRDAAHLVRALQQQYPAQGVPTMIGFERLASVSNSTQPGFWTAWLYPIPSGTYYVSAVARSTPYRISANTDRLDCSEAESLIVAALSALEGIILSGKSWLQAGVMGLLPDNVQAALRAEAVSA